MGVLGSTVKYTLIGVSLFYLGYNLKANELKYNMEKSVMDYTIREIVEIGRQTTVDGVVGGLEKVMERKRLEDELYGKKTY